MNNHIIIVVVNMITLSTYERKKSGCEKAKKVGFLPLILWVFLTIYIIVALIEILMCLKQIEASQIISCDS